VTTSEGAALSVSSREELAGWSRPTRLSVLVFQFKAAGLQLRRGWRDRLSAPPRLISAGPGAFPILLGESRSPLWSDEREAELGYQRGKVQNLRRASRDLNRVLLPGGSVFSFWRQIGRASRRRGYVAGRMLQQGCLVPAIGGGLCQLSNALYEAALKAGCEIVERHGHSRVVPGSRAAEGSDATVAWNYIDLRFRSSQPLLIEAKLDRDELVVRFLGRADAPPPARPAAAHSGAIQSTAAARTTARSCATCADTSCYRHEKMPGREETLAIIRRGRTAFLLDENWPEFRDYMRRAHRREDVLGIPLDGARWHLPRYRWDTSGFAGIGTAPLQTLARAFKSRRLQYQGPARLMAQLAAADALAGRLSRLLKADVGDACVAQSLLPHLWRRGHLGGRGFRVLMTRLPMGVLQQRLDAAAALHPERTSLADFRAPAWLVEAEAEALDAAEIIITPHDSIARLFPGKTLHLDWHRPAAPPGAALASSPAPRNPKRRRIVFPGPTIARKGAHELREAARELDLDVMPLGRALEGADFWQGLRLAARPAEPAAWLAQAAAVVQPAIVEDQPRPLLLALAAGVPVVATPACGIAPCPGLTLVPAGDAGALTLALARILNL
jgi:hypothetical protein